MSGVGIGIGIRPDPFTGFTPAGVTGHEAAGWAPVRENHGLLRCRSSLPEEVAPGSAARAWRAVVGLDGCNILKGVSNSFAFKFTFISFAGATNISGRELNTDWITTVRHDPNT